VEPQVDLFEYVGGRIRDLRLAYGGGVGLSQEALAKTLGVATNTISRWETATYHPSLDDLDKLARFFGVSILTFFPPEQQQVNEGITALLRAAEQLSPDDLEELRRYAEFRRARHLYGKGGRKAAGRRRKDAP
jgi:transcriptional regulator with XRE-family HTH domain